MRVTWREPESSGSVSHFPPLYPFSRHLSRSALLEYMRDWEGITSRRVLSSSPSPVLLLPSLLSPFSSRFLPCLPSPRFVPPLSATLASLSASASLPPVREPSGFTDSLSFFLAFLSVSILLRYGIVQYPGCLSLSLSALLSYDSDLPGSRSTLLEALFSFNPFRTNCS